MSILLLPFFLALRHGINLVTSSLTLTVPSSFSPWKSTSTLFPHYFISSSNFLLLYTSRSYDPQEGTTVHNSRLPWLYKLTASIYIFYYITHNSLPEHTHVPPPNYTYTDATSTTTYPYQIIRPLSTPSTTPSGFPPRLPVDFPFETPLGSHNSSPTESSKLTLPQEEPPSSLNPIPRTLTSEDPSHLPSTR